MLFLAHMVVNLPPSMPEAEATAIRTKEREYSQALQRDGRWVELWRVVGDFDQGFVAQHAAARNVAAFGFAVAPCGDLHEDR